MADMARIGELEKRALMVLMACEIGAIAPTPDDRSAWGIPGALISSGASAVVANLWPVEDVTSNVLAEVFLKHLGHRGYRPAAAMFRAVRDLRRMTRDEALARCRDHIAVLKAANAPGRALLGARSLLEWIEDEGMEHPFEHPYFWGATVVFGSGWHLPTGASVGPAMNIIENRLEQESATRCSRSRRRPRRSRRQKRLRTRPTGCRAAGRTRRWRWRCCGWRIRAPRRACEGRRHGCLHTHRASPRAKTTKSCAPV